MKKITAKTADKIDQMVMNLPDAVIMLSAQIFPSLPNLRRKPHIATVRNPNTGSDKSIADAQKANRSSV